MATKKVAIVTGSSGGIGRAIAEKLAQEGITVVITSRTKATADEVAQQIRKTGGEALGAEFNLDAPGSGSELVGYVLSKLGRIDYLVNNAISHPTLPPLPFEALNAELIQAGVNANLTNTLLLTHAAYPSLQKTQGAVLNIGSAVVNRHIQGIPLYAIIKGALSQATKALAAEWAKDGIRVNQLNPGFTQTEAYKNIGITKEQADAVFAYYQGFHAQNRVGQPGEIAETAAFLLSDHSKWTTGTIVDVDGGLSIQAVPAPSAGIDG